MNEGAVLMKDRDNLRSLLDQQIEIVEGFLVLSEWESEIARAESGVEVVRLRLQRRFRRLQSSRGTFLWAGRRDRRRHAQVDQCALGMHGELVGKRRLAKI